jgi:hypothetical protein
MLTAMKIDKQLLERIAALSTPHMKAVNDAVTAAFPDDNPDQMYTLAFAFQLGVLLNALDDTDRPHAIDTINSLLAKTSDYRLVRKLDS